MAEGLENRPIDVALMEDPRYLETSRYATRLQEYERYFDRERILVVTSEALRHRREATIRRVLRFLELDESLLPANLDREFHRSDAKRKLPTLVERARQSPHAAFLRRMLPSRFRTQLHQLLARPAVGAHGRELSQPLRSWLRSQLQDEIDNVGRYAPDAPLLWRL